MKLAVDVLLALGVLAAWLGCAGFVRMRAPLDRIHCVAFINATNGLCVLLAALLAEGPTPRAFKILLITGISLLAEAAMSHATGRAPAARHAGTRGSNSGETMIAMLPPLPVAGTLAIAGPLLALSTLLPRRAPDIVAIATASATAATCVIMAAHTALHPLVYWFGDWVPRAGHVLGIGFVGDQVGASFCGFPALLFAATLIFAWGCFDEVHAHFHVLTLLANDDETSNPRKFILEGDR